jgi:hypothetical protein
MHPPDVDSLRTWYTDIKALCPGQYPLTGPGLCGLPRTCNRRGSQTPSKAKFGKGHRTGSLARIEVFGLLHAVLECKAGEGFFRKVAA